MFFRTSEARVMMIACLQPGSVRPSLKKVLRVIYPVEDKYMFHSTFVPLHKHARSQRDLQKPELVSQWTMRQVLQKAEPPSGAITAAVFIFQTDSSKQNRLLLPGSQTSTSSEELFQRRGDNIRLVCSSDGQTRIRVSPTGSVWQRSGLGVGRCDCSIQIIA